MDERVDLAAAPGRVARDTVDGGGGDVADQAERLTMIMQAEAVRSALAGDGDGEGRLEGRARPLSDVESWLAEEDAEDASDDPIHAGGLEPAPWLSAEQAAMHLVDPGNPDDPRAGEAADRLLTGTRTDPFDVRGGRLTPEDETLLGIDPYGRDDADATEDGDDESPLDG